MAAPVPPSGERIFQLLGECEHLGGGLRGRWMPLGILVLAAGALPWSDGSLYRFTARVTDTAGNVTATPGETSGFQASFIYDVSQPTSAVTSVSNGHYYEPLPALAGAPWTAIRANCRTSA